MHWRIKALWAKLSSMGKARGQFSIRTRAVMALAARCAELCDSDVITSDHLLMALLDKGDGLYDIVLQQCECEREAMASDLRQRLGLSEDVKIQTTAQQRPALHEHTKQIVREAVNEARQGNHFYITTAHLLLGMLKIVDCSAARLLSEEGLGLESARKATCEAMKPGDAIDLHETWAR